MTADEDLICEAMRAARATKGVGKGERVADTQQLVNEYRARCTLSRGPIRERSKHHQIMAASAARQLRELAIR